MVWKISILVIVTVVWLYELFLHWLSMRSKSNPIPSCVADVYDEETYRKQLLYKADKNRLAMLQSAATFAVGFVLLLLNVYAAFAALFSDNTWTQLFAVVLLSAITSVVSIPFQYYDTMRIEERYGFNRTTKKTFILDQVRNVLIELVVGEVDDSVEEAMQDATPAVLRIDSSRGTVFKDNNVSTVLSVSIHYGKQIIENITALRATFGATAHLQWEWLRMDEDRYGIISADDARLSNGGFTLTLGPADVKVTFRCALITD